MDGRALRPGPAQARSGSPAAHQKPHKTKKALAHGSPAGLQWDVNGEALGTNTGANSPARSPAQCAMTMGVGCQEHYTL